jgi:sirohydrochlorin ferrochelatase
MAHGSRQHEANDDLMFVVEQVQQLGLYHIVLASFLELAEPNIETAGANCVAQGAHRVLMLPYFLSAGIHVERDLTDIRQRLTERFPEVEFRLGEPLGRHPLLVTIVAERAREMEAAAAAPVRPPGMVNRLQR